MTLSFKLQHSDGNSRAGIIHTAHGTIETPVFMPVGTYGVVKGIQPKELTKMGVNIILANTYHLMERPGKVILEESGGLRKFMGWEGPILTDSGGFQVMSLSKMSKVDEEGVTFKSHLDGSSLRLSPEISIEMQKSFGSTISMIFDECTTYPIDYELAKKSMKLSLRWAEKSKTYFSDRNGYGIFGIVQGSIYKDLRKESIKELNQLNFDGLALGGLAVGEGHDILVEVLKNSIEYFPLDKPRYLMGVGYPKDIIESVKLGIDMFDCVLPTRSGRTGKVFTKYGQLNIRNARYKNDFRPLDIECKCDVCAKKVSRSYLHHLSNIGDMLASIYLTLHNINHYVELMSDIRNGIINKNFDEVAEKRLKDYEKGDIDLNN